MTIKQLLSEVARLVLKGELADKLSGQQALSNEENLEMKQLLKGFNLTLNEVATEYLSLSAEERKFGNTIYFTSFSHAPLDIVSVRDDRGGEMLFTVYPDRIQLERANWYTVRYNYIPDDKAETDVFDYEHTKIGKRAFLYGTASEYCLMTGRYEEAANWRSKFEKAVSSPFTRKGKKIKGRIWG